MPNETYIKNIKKDDKYDFFNLYLEIVNGSNVQLEDRRFLGSDSDIRRKLKMISSYKDFEKLNAYFLKRGKETYIKQIINNSNVRDILSSFITNKTLNIDNGFVKNLYFLMNTNTKLEIMSLIESSDKCLTYNVSEQNIKILEKCLDSFFENIFEIMNQKKDYYTIQHINSLSLLLKVSGFIPISSFNTKYIFEKIDETKALLGISKEKAKYEREIKSIVSDILILDCMRSYFSQETSFDIHTFTDNNIGNSYFNSFKIAKLHAFLFSDSCSISKESSHEFIKKNKMTYDVRSTFYYFRVRLGKANIKLSRIARSDASEECCKTFITSLLASLKMYSDDEILDIVAQFTDCKHVESSILLYNNLPQKYKYLMLSNKNVRRYCK